MTRPASLRAAAALLLILATVVFAIGIAVEHANAGESTDVQPVATAASGASSQEGAGQSAVDGEKGHGEGEEVNGEHAEREGETAAEIAKPVGEAAEGHTASPAESHNEGGETILGLDPESTGTVAAAVLISLLLAVALWLWGTPPILVIAAVVALVFAAFDGREVLHQVAESRAGLAAIALLAAALHVAAAAVAGVMLARGASPVGSARG
jgi:hypothetical protein